MADPKRIKRIVVGIDGYLAELGLVPPVPAAARVLCVGLNYPAHVVEGNPKSVTWQSRR